MNPPLKLSYLPVLCALALAASSGCVPPSGASCPEIRKATADTIRQERLAGLGFLLGRWEGSGWIQLGRDQRESFRQTERVETRLEGSIVTIEGHGRSEGEGGEEKSVHRAFAVIRWDAAQERPIFSSFLADGRSLQADATIGENRVEWGYQDPRAGQIRYAIRVTPEGSWQETGERSGDGVTWSPFFEMTLKRVAAETP